MSNKTILRIALLNIFIFSVVGCGERNLSNSSTRLVGHWAVVEGGRRSVEEYFGKLDSNAVGSYIGSSGDNIYYAHYRILSESEENVTIEIFIGSDTLPKDYEFDKDGKSMKSGIEEYLYIDSKTAP